MAGVMLQPGGVVTLKLGYRCCIGSPGVSLSKPIVMPNVVGKRLDAALREVKASTGFYAVSVPATTATTQPLLAITVTKQWPALGFDLRRQTHGFRLPQLTVASG